MTHKIETFDDACKALSLSPNELPEVSNIPERLQKFVIAAFKLAIIAEALNEGWNPDWSNWGQRKYFAWFEVKATKETPSGSGFSYSFYVSSITCTGVGSRLCFKSQDLALYAGKQFEEIYQDYLLMN